jgi:hypothetical protein
MLRSVTSCLMCAAPLSDLQQLQKAGFCGERCRWQYATMPPGRQCAVCGRRLSLGESVAGLCSSPECRHKAGEPARERQRQEDAARKQRAGEFRDRQAEVLGLDEPETYRPAVIPAFRRRVTNLADRRRRAFRDHLNRLISEASESRAPSTPNDAGPPAVSAPTGILAPELQVIMGGACALCQGFCCAEGNDHAYLTVATIRRYVSQHPGQRPRDVLAAYLDRVGNKTFEGSCIFHQPGGCNLPPAMRSDTCNRYFCQGLTEFRQGSTAQDRPRGFFVSMSGDVIRAAAFCDEETSRVVSVSTKLE